MMSAIMLGTELGPLLWTFFQELNSILSDQTIFAGGNFCFR